MIRVTAQTNHALPSARLLRAVAATCIIAPCSHGGLLLSQWTGATSDQWSVAANWSPAAVPNGGGPDGFAVTLPSGSFARVDMLPTISTLTVERRAEVLIESGRILRINQGLLTNDGTVRISTLGADTELMLAGHTTIAGLGEIVLEGGPLAALAVDGGLPQVVTIAAGQTVRGAGRIGAGSGGDGQGFRLNNFGLIEATSPNAPLTLRVSGAVAENHNRGTIRASGGRVLITSSALDNDQGLIVAGDGQRIDSEFSTIKGGTGACEGSGVFRCVAGTTEFVPPFSFQGTLEIVDGALAKISGPWLDHGVIKIDGDESSARLFIGPATTLSGGVVELGPGAESAIMPSDVGNVLTLARDQVVRGCGTIRTFFVNNGLIEATAPPDLTIRVDSGDGTSINNSVIRASGTTLIVNGPLDNTNGLLLADPGSVLRLGAGLVTGGIVRSAGSGSIILRSQSKFQDVRLEGVVHSEQTNSPHTLSFGGVIENDAEVNLGVNTGFFDILMLSDTTWTGSGSIRLEKVFLAPSASTLTIAPGHVVRGNGTIHCPLINLGSLIADKAPGLTFGVTSFVNHGVISAVAPGSLKINSPLFTNERTLEIKAGSSLLRNQGGWYVQAAGSTRLNGVFNSIGLVQFHVVGGMLEGTGSMDCALYCDGGTVAPGSPLGVLTTEWIYEQGANGTLAIEIGGAPGSSAVDRLDTGGAVTLAGTLRVRRVGGFIPTVGQTYTVLTSPKPITGVFDVIDACDAIAVTYTSNEVRVTFTALPSGTGDINHDGSVDGADLAEVLGHWGSCPDACCSDLDGDGSVSGTDLAIVLGNWD